MKRNKERIWFEKGYRQAVSDKKIESFPVKFTGIGLLIALSFIEPFISLTAFVMWSIFEYFQWRDEKKYGVDYDPPREWEWDS